MSREDSAREIYALISRAAPQRDLEFWRAALTLQIGAASKAQPSTTTSARTLKGISALLIQRYREQRKISLKKADIIMNHVRELEREAESGADIKGELSALALEWKVGSVDPSSKPTLRQQRQVKRREREIKKAAKVKKVKRMISGSEDRESSCAGDSSAPLARTREESAPQIKELIIAPSSDPYARHQALLDLAQGIAQELPPPSLPDHKIGQEFVGRARGDLRAEWINYIDQVARRWPGPLTSQDLHRITGAPERWTSRLLGEWRALLERGLSEDQRRSMALSMSAEAEAIAREALALVQSSGDERLKAAGLKLALDSLARRQSLIGADQISLAAPVEVSEVSWTEHAAAAGLSAEDLKDIGDIASRAMSRPNKNNS